MFGNALTSGLQTLGNWETYVSLSGYIALVLITRLGTAAISEKGGCLVGLLAMCSTALAEAAAMAALVFAMSPLILGTGTTAAWTVLWQVVSSATGSFLRLAGILALIAFFVGFIPFLGDKFSFHTLVLGGTMLVIMIESFERLHPGTVHGVVSYVPGIWFSVGLLVIVAVSVFGGALLLTLLETAMKIENKAVSLLFELPVSGVLGIIPLFVYGAWLGDQLAGGA